jgi:hypothetical protein
MKVYPSVSQKSGAEMTGEVVDGSAANGQATLECTQCRPRLCPRSRTRHNNQETEGAAHESRTSPLAAPFFFRLTAAVLRREI